MPWVRNPKVRYSTVPDNLRTSVTGIPEASTHLEEGVSAYWADFAGYE